MVTQHSRFVDMMYTCIFFTENDPAFFVYAQEAETMFQHLDINSDGNIDLAEFTRFCLEVNPNTLLWRTASACTPLYTCYFRSNS